MGEVYLDSILVPMSLFLTVGYHAYLWHCFRNNPLQTSIGIDSHIRRLWFHNIKLGDDPRRSLIAVQSLRNTQMVTILRASIAILISTTLAALSNNAYMASHLFKSSTIFGMQSGNWIFALKYASALLFFLASFGCSSLGLGFVMDSSLLVSVPDPEFSYLGYTEMVLDCGSLLAFVGNRVLGIAFTLFLWILGPVPVWLSSVALVWGFYMMDFPAKFTNHSYKQYLS